ncbi:zinc finger BED domain-containing protein DAYSLEEPER-like [Cicer arietinum]|uniref:zinc finger BED domain-containing protein DAYSLEEPER-like n=1 Tax=Cicer arietinum TaxID=3827 RepID=UPI003CC51F78
MSTGGLEASTSHLKRHARGCNQKKLQTAAETRQVIIPFQPSKSSNPFISTGVRYSNEKMREIITTTIMVHKYPFSVVEDDIWMWGFQYANPDFHKVTHKTTRNDCLAIFDMEKKILKKFLESVSKISLTTNMWKSSRQVVEYMVITGHFIDVGWNLQKRVLSFVKVPPPRRGIDVVDAIYKCLKTWGIENKVFSISVDNASYNDSCLRCLKDNLSLSKVWKVKQILDKTDEDEDIFMKEMCNMLMAIASVLDPRCKFHMVRICFPLIYKSKEVVDENIKKVICSLEELYDEYLVLSLEESSSPIVNLDCNNLSSSQENVAIITGFDEILSILRENETVPPVKSELQDYLDEGIYVPKTKSFCALDWWRNNSMKYKILSKMVADVLAIPISIVAS